MHKDPPQPSEPPRFLVPLLLALSVLPYLNILGNALFLDDLDTIVNNAYIRDWRYLPRLFTESMVAGAGKSSDYYRPAILAAFTFGHSIWGLNPAGYHAFSILSHAACALLAFRLLRRLSADWRSSFLAAALFAAHPVQTESVASASALGIPMGLAFALSALLAFSAQRADPAAGKRAAWAGLHLVGTAAALLCKETMVVVPGLVFLADFCFLSSEAGLKRRFRSSLLRSLPALAVVAAYVLLRFTALNFGGTENLFRAQNVFTENWSVRFYTFLAVLLEIAKLLVWPHPLYMERNTVIPVYVSPWFWPVLLGFSLLAAVLFFGWRAARSLSAAGDGPQGSLPSRIAAFGVGWFCFSLVPVSNILIPISTTLVESWIYPPLLGPAWIVARAVTARGARAWPVCAALLLLFGWMTARQNRIWKNAVVFYEHHLAHAPNSARFRNNLAMAYADEKRYADAVAQYLEAIRLNDQYPETRHNLANSYAALGRLADAEKEYLAAIAMNPAFYHSYISLAALYARARRMDLAQDLLERLLANVPNRWESYYNLGAVYLEKGEKARALAVWRKGLEADPYNRFLKQALAQLP